MNLVVGTIWELKAACVAGLRQALEAPSATLRRFHRLSEPQPLSLRQGNSVVPQCQPSASRNAKQGAP